MAYDRITNTSAGAAMLRVFGITGVALALLLAIGQSADAFTPPERPVFTVDGGGAAENVKPAGARFHGGHRFGFGKRFFGPKFGFKAYHGGYYRGFYGQGRIFHKNHYGARFGFRKFRGERFYPKYIGKHHGYHSPGQF